MLRVWDSGERDHPGTTHSMRVVKSSTIRAGLFWLGNLNTTCMKTTSIFLPDIFRTEVCL